ncbi:MAG: tetratricopeptide repeat-containing sensor histidine kinase [Bacteroidales bacterium]|nr:tetratricopeptide repeat-containing sensor histidine kinase [Bacteroidales bacterium]
MVCSLHAWGNSKADELRKSMYAAPDTAKAVILTSIAKLYQYENADSCMYYAQQAAEMAHRTQQDLALADAETLMSQIALERKDYVRATNHQRIILEVTLRMRNWDMVMESYNAIAQTWLLRDNYAEAVEYLKKGLEIARERNNLELSKYYYQALIDSYRKLRNMDAVCEYYPQLMEVNRKVDAEAYNNRINALQTERETLITAAEDAKNRGQQRSPVLTVFDAIASIWAALATVALVAAIAWFCFRYKPGTAKAQKEMNDKAMALDALVKNQESAFRFLTNHIYTSINSLAQTIALFEEEQGDLPVAMNSTLNRINNSIFALYGFFQNFTLLLQAQSGQLKPEPATVNIPQLAANLLADYEDFAAAKEIQLANEVQNNTFAIADERLVDVVLRNMMSNAFKYAPTGTGRISVGTKVGTRVETREGIVEDPGFVEVWVTDDGIGLTPEQAGKLFDLTDNLALPGDLDSKGYGIGLAVCKAVIETFKGRIWAETKPGEGFCIRFCLPGAKDAEVKTLGLIENIQKTGSEQDAPDNHLLSE